MKVSIEHVRNNTEEHFCMKWWDESDREHPTFETVVSGMDGSICIRCVDGDTEWWDLQTDFSNCEYYEI